MEKARKLIAAGGNATRYVVFIPNEGWLTYLAKDTYKYDSDIENAIVFDFIGHAEIAADATGGAIRVLHYHAGKLLAHSKSGK